MKRVLIVDDESENRYLLRALLEGYGYFVEEAQQGVEALTKARLMRPELVISDLMMPVMDGYALLREWKSDPELCSIPFVVYTATYRSPKDERLGRDLGADAFIIKPAEPASFMLRLAEVLAKARHGELSPPQARNIDDAQLLTSYTATLIRKLEDKATQLECVNRSLREDIMQREQAEAQARRLLEQLEHAHVQLLEKDARLRLALEAARMRAFAWDIAAQAAPDHPAAQSDARFEAFTHSIHPADRAGFMDELARCVETDSPFRRELRVISAVGESWLAVHGEFEREAAGGQLRLRGVIQDVTERRHAQQAVLQKTAQLETALEMARMGVWSWDFQTDEVVTLEGHGPVSKLLSLADTRRASVLMNLIDPEDRTVLDEKIARAKAGEEYEAEFRMALSGELRWVVARGRCVRDHNGQPIALTGLDQDITERKLLEERLRNSQRLEAVGQLAGGIAHDFNNILAAVIGNAELARIYLTSGQSALECITEILRAGQRAKELTSRILTFSRPHAFRLRPIDIQSVLEEAERLLRATLPAGVDLSFQNTSGVPVVRAEASQIHQIVLNLVTNSWHALEGKPGRIETRLDGVRVDSSLSQKHPELKPGAYARLTVTDTGVGMDAATLEHMFEPFFTTKTQGQGAGLGLSVVHGIVRGHGGAIFADSQPGRGTTFNVFLPACPEGTRVITPSEPAPTCGTRGHGEHIMYIDDEESLVYLAVRFLEHVGYRVDGYTRGDEALRAFRQHPGSYDIVITDFNMPGMSGMDLAKQVISIRPDAPVALTTGYLRPAEIEQAHALGIREVIPKPYLIEELGPLVQRMLAVASPQLTATK